MNNEEFKIISHQKLEKIDPVGIKYWQQKLINNYTFYGKHQGNLQDRPWTFE